MAANIIDIVQGTTPSLSFIINGYDLTSKTVEIYITHAGGKLYLTNDRMGIAYSDDASTIALQLTQAETLKLPVGAASVQIRFINESGQTDATIDGAAKLNVHSIAKRAEIVYRGDGNG